MDFFAIYADDDIDWDRYHDTSILRLMHRPKLETFPAFTTIVKLTLEGLPLLRHLPDDFCNMRHLEELVIHRTGLIDLPSALGDMDSITRLSIEDNPGLPVWLQSPWHSWERTKMARIKTFYGSCNAAYTVLLAYERGWKKLPHDIVKMIARECIEPINPPLRRNDKKDYF